jgi:hypothetical protein
MNLMRTKVTAVAAVRSMRAIFWSLLSQALCTRALWTLFPVTLIPVCIGAKVRSLFVWTQTRPALQMNRELNPNGVFVTTPYLILSEDGAILPEPLPGSMHGFLLSSHRARPSCRPPRPLYRLLRPLYRLLQPLHHLPRLSCQLSLLLFQSQK